MVVTTMVQKTMLVVVLALLAVSPGARAQVCNSPYYTWSPTTVSVGTGVASAPAQDTSFQTGGKSYSFIAQGPTLYQIRNVADAGGAAGTIVTTWTDPTATTIQNFPSPVPLSAGGEYIFLAATDGFLYKLNAANLAAPPVTADTRRTGVGACTSDQLVATPTVQLFNFANCAFKNAINNTADCGATQNSPNAFNDLIFVITRTMCGDLTSNRIIAYHSNTLTVRWTFNGAFTKLVGYGSEGCAIDYNANTIFCGTDLPDSATGQNSLFAINSLNGQLRWAGPAGPIRNRPQLANGKLYVGTYLGDIQAYDPLGDVGKAKPLQTAVHVPGLITNNIWPEFRPGPAQGRVFLRDSTNRIHAVGPDPVTGSPTLIWSSVQSNYTTMPVVEPATSKLYAGRSDGIIEQLDLVGGFQQAGVTVNASATVYDASLDVEPGTAIVNRMVVAAAGVGAGAGKVTRVCLPLANNPSGSGGAGCGSDAACLGKTANGRLCTFCDPCLCDVGGNNQCFRAPMAQWPPDGTACNDGKDCTCDSTHADGAGNCTSIGANDVCRSRVCTSDFYKTCTCTNPGDRACNAQAGLTCCGAANGGCVNLQTDPAHCGACDINCGGGACIGGLCKQSTSCSTPTDTQIFSAGVPGANGIAFERTSGNVCAAYLSTYRVSPNVSAIYKVSPGGSSVAYNSPVGDFTPLHGVAVPRQGDQVFGSYVNNGVSFTPGGALDEPLGTNLQKLAGAAQTGNGAGPFTEQRYNYGPVGPAFDYVVYVAGTPTSRNLYYGNYASNGTLSRVSWSGAAWTTSAVTYSNPGNERITAIAFERRWNRGNTPKTKDRHLYIAHGKTLSLLNLDTGAQTDADVDAKLIKANSEGTVTGILGIAVHPVFGDIYLEVRNATGTQFVIDMNDNDLRGNNMIDVTNDQHLGAFPASFANQGRIAMTPAMNLIRLVPQIDLSPVSVTTYEATPAN